MKVEREDLGRNLSDMKRSGYTYLVKITAVDYSDHLEAIYILRNMDERKDVSVEVKLAPTDLWLDTVISQFPAADWYERELQEMFGILIKGRKADRLLLEKWDGREYPLRRSFEWGKDYERM